MILSKYRIDSRLGEGGMGSVFSATHLRIGNRVALKMLKPELADNPLLVERFEREARASIAIRSEHVARVLDVETLESGLPMIVMEFLDGRDLAMELEDRGSFPPEEAAAILLQACEAIAEAHSLGIVHRDLKPSNLFLTRRADGSRLVKVMDFGIAKAVSERGEPSITRTQDIVGSPLYMAPEQVRSSRDVDERADIWSLGVVLFELLSGATPFEGQNSSAVLAAVVADRPLSLQTFVGEVPQELLALLDRCLEKSPEDRYANIAELAWALRPFAPADSQISLDRIQGILARGAASNNTDPPAHAASRRVPPTLGATQPAPNSSSEETQLDAKPLSTNPTPIEGSPQGVVSSGSTSSSRPQAARAEVAPKLWLALAALLGATITWAVIASRPSSSASLETSETPRDIVPERTDSIGMRASSSVEPERASAADSPATPADQPTPQANAASQPPHSTPAPTTAPPPKPLPSVRSPSPSRLPSGSPSVERQERPAKDSDLLDAAIESRK